MRLSEMRIIIRENQEKLKISVENVNGNSGVKSISKVPECLNALNALKSIPSLAKIVQQAESIQSISRIQTEQAILIDTPKANAFVNVLTMLNNHCNAIMNLADSILPEMSENTICIKLPDTLSAEALNEITEAFSRFFASIIPEGERQDCVHFIGVESGCSWLYYAIASTTVLTIAKKAVALITEAFEKYVQLKKSLLVIKSMQLDCEIKEDETALKKKILRETLSQFEAEQTPEQHEKLIAASVSLLKIMENGTEIHPSLAAGNQDEERKARSLYERIQNDLNDLKLLCEGLSQPTETEPSQDPVPEDSCGDSNPIEK